MAATSDSMRLFSLSSSAKMARSLDCAASSFAFYEASQATRASPSAWETLLSILDRVSRASVKAASLSFFSSKAAVRSL